MVHRTLHCLLLCVASYVHGIFWTGQSEVLLTRKSDKDKCLYHEACIFALQDVSAESSLKMPELYKCGQRQELSSPLKLSLHLLYAVYTSLILFFIPFGVFYNTAFDYQTMAVTVAMAAMFTASIEVKINFLWPSDPNDLKSQNLT